MARRKANIPSGMLGAFRAALSSIGSKLGGALGSWGSPTPAKRQSRKPKEQPDPVQQQTVQPTKFSPPQRVLPTPKQLVPNQQGSFQSMVSGFSAVQPTPAVPPQTPIVQPS